VAEEVETGSVCWGCQSKETIQEPRPGILPLELGRMIESCSCRQTRLNELLLHRTSDWTLCRWSISRKTRGRRSAAILCWNRTSAWDCAIVNRLDLLLLPKGCCVTGTYSQPVSGIMMLRAKRCRFVLDSQKCLELWDYTRSRSLALVNKVLLQGHMQQPLSEEHS
jgi:hypothetical protein